MTDEQREHLGSIQLDFNRRVQKKYEAGAKEHGGNLWEKPLKWQLEQVMEEAIDSYTYAYTALEQLNGR